MSDAPRASIRFGPPVPPTEIRLICNAGALHRKRPDTLMGTFTREDRWDGSGGHYWVFRGRQSRRERENLQAARPGEPNRLPRSYFDRETGFRYMRGSEPIADPAEARAAGNAMHHNAGPGRRGEPAPGIADGVWRRFTVPACKCGQYGIDQVRGEHVETALDALLAQGETRTELRTLRAAVDTLARMHTEPGGGLA